MIAICIERFFFATLESLNDTESSICPTQGALVETLSAEITSRFSSNFKRLAREFRMFEFLSVAVASRRHRPRS
jgi:molybdopterin converting factor small subunit